MLTVQTLYIGEVTVMRLTGRLDSINARQAQSTLDDILADNDQTPLILDMEGVEYMSAAGLRILRRLKERTGSVTIAAPSDRVTEVMQITGLDVVYQLHRTRIGAVHGVRPVTAAYTNLEQGWLNHLCPGPAGRDFLRWRSDVNRDTRSRTTHWHKQADEAIERGIQTLIDAGITVIADVSSSGMSIRPLLDSGLRGTVYIEVRGTAEAQIQANFNNMRDIIERWQPAQRDNGIQIGICLHAPYSVHPNLWQKTLDYARKEALPLCIPIAQSRAEYDFMLSGTGKLAEALYDETHMPALQSPGVSPLAYLEQTGALDLKPLLIHAIHVDDDDIQRIKESGCTVVHCPRSNVRLQCGRMPLESYLAQDIPVLIGTDSLACSPSLDIFDEIEFAIGLHYERITPEKIVSLVHGTLPSIPEPPAADDSTPDESQDEA